MLELAGERPLLAAQLHAESAGEQLLLARVALERVFAGESGVAALSAALAGADLGRTLGQLVDAIQGLLRSLDGPALASARARAGFQLLDEIRQLQRAIGAGSNPNPQLLLDPLLGKVQKMLGDGGLDDNIGSNQKGARR